MTISATLLAAVITCLQLSYSFDINTLQWNSDSVALWADFGIKNVSLTDYEAKFIATHYDIISLEKCLGSPQSSGVPTEIVFYNLSTSIRRYASSQEIKILFYFASDVAICECYNITTPFCKNQSMFFTDDNGNNLYSNGLPYYDHTQSYVRRWWTDAVKQIMITAKEQYNISINGIFADGIQAYFGGNPNISQARVDQLNDAKKLLLNETRTAFAEIGDDLMVIGNGLNTYPQLSNGTEFLPFVDGLLGEHFGAFEEVIAKPNATLNVTDLLFWFRVSAEIATSAPDKVLLMKAWVGPEVSPIDATGPSWPETYYLSTPTTHEQRQNASLQLITFPLATFLCGIYHDYVYFSYAWWYDITQGYVPCPDEPSSCDCPLGWYPEFINKLGAPKTNGVLSEGTKCNRTFENAEIYVDLNDGLSAVIRWM